MASGRKRQRETILAHAAWVDSLVDRFESELASMIHTAQARTLADLAAALKVDGGRILQAPANLRVLRRVDKMFEAAMERAGYSHLVEVFVDSFNGHLPYFETLIETISDTLQTPLSVQWTKADETYLAARKLSAVDQLGTVVEAAAVAAKREALFSVGALKYVDLVEMITRRFALAIPAARTIADTSTTMFYREITDRGFQQIEDGLAPGAAKYRYDGPDDKITRVFCEHALHGTKLTDTRRGLFIPAAEKGGVWERKKIDEMENGQLPDVWVTCGGYKCRHQWVIDAIVQ